MERKFHKAFVPVSEKAWERKGQAAKVPGSELARVLLAYSLRGANWPGSEKARYHVYTGISVPVTTVIGTKMAGSVYSIVHI